jgi:hypothetical protein
MDGDLAPAQLSFESADVILAYKHTRELPGCRSCVVSTADRYWTCVVVVPRPYPAPVVREAWLRVSSDVILIL